jgi:hypothetical protein
MVNAIAPREAPAAPAFAAAPKRLTEIDGKLGKTAVHPSGIALIRDDLSVAR